MRIRRGDTVTYPDPNIGYALNRAAVVGQGWHKGRRSIYLDNGQWCFRDDVRPQAAGVSGDEVPAVSRPILKVGVHKGTGPRAGRAARLADAAQRRQGRVPRSALRPAVRRRDRVWFIRVR